jgi:hypothetical protein
MSDSASGQIAGESRDSRLRAKDVETDEPLAITGPSSDPFPNKIGKRSLQVPNGWLFLSEKSNPETPTLASSR